MVKRKKTAQFWTWWNSNITFMLAFKWIVLILAWMYSLGVLPPILFCYKQVKQRQIRFLLFASNVKKRGYLSWFECSSISARSKSVQYPNPTPINCHVKLLKKVGGIKGFSADTNAVAKWTLNRDFRQKISAVLTRCVTWPLHWVFIIFYFNAWIYGLQSYQYFQKSLHQSVRSDFGKKWHLTASVVGLQCLLRLLIIISYYMKMEKIFSRIFSKVQSLQQQKGFTIWSREVTTKCFWQKKTSSSCT